MNSQSLLDLSVLANQYYGQVLVKTSSNICFWQILSVLLVVFQMAVFGKPFNEFNRDLPLANQQMLRATTTLPLIRQTKKVNPSLI